MKIKNRSLESKFEFCQKNVRIFWLFFIFLFSVAPVFFHEKWTNSYEKNKLRVEAKLVFWDLLKETLQRDQYSTDSLYISIDTEKEISSSFMLIAWIQTVWSLWRVFFSLSRGHLLDNNDTESASWPRTQKTVGCFSIFSHSFFKHMLQSHKSAEIHIFHCIINI